MEAKGNLMIIGGAEKKDEEKKESKTVGSLRVSVLGCLLDLMNKEQPRIEIVTTASSIPDEMADMYMQAFERLGCNNTGHLKIVSRQEAAQVGILKRIKDCDCVLFTGGDQLRLTTVFGGTPFIEMLNERYRKESRFVIAGSSAGAMAMSSIMINGGDARRAHLKGEVNICPGLGLLPNLIIDTHFDKRGRFYRLLQGVLLQPGVTGVGLAEDTGIIVSDGKLTKAVGSSIVTVINGHNIRYNNIAEVDCGLPLAVENVVVHVLSKNMKYDLSTGQFITVDTT